MAQLMDKAKNFVAEKIGNIKKPEATVTDFDLSSVHRDRVEYGAKLSVNNPYGTSIPVGHISYTLKSNNRVIASGTIPDPGSLTANTTTILNLAVNVPHNVLLSLARDIGADGDIDYELELGLTVDLPVVGDITIPVSSKGEIKLPTLSDLI